MDEEKPRTRIGPLSALGVALVALAGILFWSPFWLDRIVAGLHLAPPLPMAASAPQPEPSTAASVPMTTAPSPSMQETPAEALSSEGAAPGVSTDDATSTSPTEDDVVVDEPSPEPDASPGLEAGGAPDTLAAQPTAPPSAAPEAPEASPLAAAASPQPGPSASARPKARLAISFEHGIETGTIRILVDRKPVLAQKLTSRVTKDLLLFKLRSGVVRDTLSIAPGQRRVRVEVRTPDEVRTKETVVSFRPGRTRHLEVKIGRLRGNLSLAWR